MSRSPSAAGIPDAQVSEFNSFQQIYINAQASLDKVCSSFNSLIDVAQIKTFEDMYRVLDTHISYLLPFIGLQFDNYNVQGIISNIRNLQTSLEDKLHTFYQNLSE